MAMTIKFDLNEKCCIKDLYLACMNFEYKLFDAVYYWILSQNRTQTKVHYGQLGIYKFTIENNILIISKLEEEVV